MPPKDNCIINLPEEDEKMKLSTLLKMFRDDLFEIHFVGYECLENYIEGEWLTGNMCLSILHPDILNSIIVESHLEVYGDELSGICITVDYKLNLDKGVSE